MRSKRMRGQKQPRHPTFKASRSEPIWKSLESAPKCTDNDNIIKIDILAKTWLKEPDQFAYERFPDCYWSWADVAAHRKACWMGLPANWLPVAWMPRPPIPSTWPTI